MRGGLREIEIAVSGAALADGMGLPDASEVSCIALTSPVRLTRTGRAVRLIQTDGSRAVAVPDPTLVKLLLRAQNWWEQLATGEIDVERLAQQEQVTTSYVSRIVRLAFLSPAIVDAITIGRQPAELDGAFLTRPKAVPIRWDEQAGRLETLLD